MFTTITLALLLGQAPTEPLATDAEKKEFLKLIETLPRKGEFFTDEGVEKARRFTSCAWPMRMNLNIVVIWLDLLVAPVARRAPV